MARLFNNLESQMSLEFKEGYAAYGDGIDGYAATPYPECTEAMTDWFAGWITARSEDMAEVGA